MAEQSSRSASASSLQEEARSQPTPRPAATVNDWSPQASSDLYGLSDWGKGFFGVDPKGQLTVLPAKDPRHALPLIELVEGLRHRGIHAPVLLRFPDMLEHRLQELRSAFDEAIRDYEYQGSYRCVYPIKVNQQRHICEEVRDIGARLGFGLEAGSKPELLAVLGLTAGHNEMPIICNGFKDDEFIETVILATKLGRTVYPVVEKYSELELLIQYAQQYEVRPRIGIRVKLSSRGSGRWQSSSGHRSKFGLFVSEIMHAFDRLREVGMEDCLQMIHCHIGSQISDVRSLQAAVTELARVYAELRRLGAGLDTLDVGGGLGIDYDGSQTNCASSINYSLSEYAAEVVHRILVVCDETHTPHPNIITESGRALVTYSSVLIVNVLGNSNFDREPDRETLSAASDDEATPPPIQQLIEVHRDFTDYSLMECFHVATEARDLAMSSFHLGHLPLPMRALAEELYWSISRRLVERARQESDSELPEEIAGLEASLSDIYFCNFSIFQSLPDSWAIDQVFPICPIHRLEERPTRKAILADITCDSDGQIDRFADRREERRTLDLHAMRPDEAYYLGFFLIGAYQEILGDLHNLLGDTHAVHIKLDPDGHWSIEEMIEGDSVAEVLQYVNFEPVQLRETMRRDVERAMRRGLLSVPEGRSLVRYFNEGLVGYTYLE